MAEIDIEAYTNIIYNCLPNSKIYNYKQVKEYVS